MLLALAAFALQPAPLTHLRPMSYHPPAPSCQRSRHIDSKIFSPAYDGVTQRYAADWANLRSLQLNDLEAHLSPLLFNLLITVAVCAFHASPWLFLLSSTGTHLATTLGLLLVFRTNAAYDRFWEARKVWGVITSDAARLRQRRHPHDAAASAAILSLVAAFPVATKAYLRGAREERYAAAARPAAAGRV